MFDFLVALYHYCADYHSGQWSREYKAMCLAVWYLKREWDYNVTLDNELTLSQLVLFHKIREKHDQDYH